MGLWRMRTAFGLAVLAGIFAALPALALPPVEAFADLPEYSRPALSPDGKHVALIRSFEGHSTAEILTVDAPESVRPARVDATGGNISSVAWASNTRLIIIVKINRRAGSAGRLYTWWRAFSVDTDGKNPAMMLDNAPLGFNFSSANIADIDLDDPDHVYMPLVGPGVTNSWPALHIYRVDVNTGQSTIAVPGTMWTADWVMDGHGHVVARVDKYSRELRYHIFVPAAPDYREIGAFDLTAGGTVHVGGVSQDGTGLVLEMPGDTRRRGLFRVDLTTKATTPLFTNATYDVYRSIRDEWTNRVVGVTYIGDRLESVWFDPLLQRLQGALERAFPGRQVVIESCDVARKSCVAEIEGPRNPPSYYFVDVPTLHASLIGSAYPRLHESDLGEMRPYNYPARDGREIPGYLTLPPGRAAKNLPLVVMPHGGPEARDYIAFDWWAQFLANRGYAVLQPNFRGSAGYGEDFTAAGFHQWGLKMQDDLADGVAKLAADGIADPKRACIVGASYGGYAALAGAALSPDAYACAVSVAGVSDLDAMLREEERLHGDDSVAMSYLQSRVGDRSADSARIAATSPALQATAIKIPILLLHGAQDTTVPVAQSETMRAALVAAHKTVTFIALESDDHYLDLAETRARVLSEIEKFLAANIGR